MEVETRPPLLDGQLGLHVPTCDVDLRLRLSDTDLLSDEDRVTLKSPTDEELLLMEDLVDSSCDAGKSIMEIVRGVDVKCNGEVDSEMVANPRDVFRTGVEKSDKCDRLEEKISAQSVGVSKCSPSKSSKDESSTSSLPVNPSENVTCKCSASKLLADESVTSEKLPESHEFPKAARNISNSNTSMDNCEGGESSYEAIQYDEVHSSELVIEDPNSIEDLKVSGACDTGDGMENCTGELKEITTEEPWEESSKGSQKIVLSCQGDSEPFSVKALDADKERNASDVYASFLDEKFHDNSEVQKFVGEVLSKKKKSDETDTNLENFTDPDMNEDQGLLSLAYPQITEDILPVIESELDEEGAAYDSDVECYNTTDGEGSEEAQDVLPMEVTEHSVGQPSSNVEKSGKNGDGLAQGILDEVEMFTSSQKLKRRVSTDQIDHHSYPLPRPKKRRRMSVDNDFMAVDIRKSFEKFLELKIGSQAVGESVETNNIDDTYDSVPSANATSAKNVGRVSSSSPVHVGRKQSKNDKNSIMVLDSDDEDLDSEINSGVLDSEKKNQDKGPIERRSALDNLFNGQKEIILNRKMFSKIMESYVSQYLMSYGEFGKATALALKAETMMSKLQTAVANFEKQKEEFRLVMKKLVDDRQANKKWDETLIPQKMTRSVGLQVCTIGSYSVKTAAGDASRPSQALMKRGKGNNVSGQYSTVVSTQKDELEQQKEALADQQKALFQPRNITTNQVSGGSSSIASRPTAKKSVTSLPNSRMIQRKNNIAEVNNAVTNFPYQKIVPRLNGLAGRAPAILQSPNKVIHVMKSPTSNSSALQVTGNSSARAAVGPFQRNTLQKSISIPTKVLQIPSQLIASRPVVTSTPITLSSTQQQGSKNLVSGPGRPGVVTSTSSNVVVSSLSTTNTSDHGLVIQMNTSTIDRQKKATPTTSLPLEATIDLTDLDDEGPAAMKTPVNPAGSEAGKSLPTKAVCKSALSGSLAAKPMRYPPLPSNPANFNPATAPPKPYLGICDTQTVTQGIMLTWHFSNVQPLRKVVKFQVYAYQESKGDSEDAWKKVGDVDALPLPMACTLTQFREGYTYHFIVRAIDERGDPGPFSAPSTITLLKKT